MSQVNVSDLDDDFSAADGNAGGDFESLPDGSYQVVVDRVEIDWTKGKSPERMFRWTFKVLVGPHTNRKIWKTALLRPDLLKWLKSDVWKCGWQVKHLSELQRNLSKLLDTWLEIKLQTKEVDGKERQNVFITKLIDGKDTNESRGGDDPPPPTDDDIPF